MSTPVYSDFASKWLFFKNFFDFFRISLFLPRVLPRFSGFFSGSESDAPRLPPFRADRFGRIHKTNFRFVCTFHKEIN